MIEVNNIVKNYITGDFDFTALKSVSLKIEKGEFTSIMGPSGSGKSTFMNILGCLDRMNSGTYILNDKDVSNLSDNELAYIRNKEIGFVFQAFNLLPRMTILENVELPMVYAGVPRKERKERAMEALKKVDLLERVKHKSNEISGGQRQRVAIARAIVNQPNVVMADEPTGNLDSKSSIEIMKIFEKLNMEGVTVLMVTHEPDIANYTKRIVRFKDGEIVSDEPVLSRTTLIWCWEAAAMKGINIIENFKMSIDSIKSNKMRSFLTMLGIIIGISSVITIVSLGQGGQNTITSEFEKIGASTVTLKVNTGKASKGDYFTANDIKAISDKVSTVKYVTPVVQKQGVAVTASKSKRASITGGNEKLIYLQNIEILYGRFYNEREAKEGKNVMVIDEASAKNLFGYSDVVGLDLMVGPKASTKKFKIIGVAKGFSGIFGGGDNSGMPAFIYVPDTSLKNIYPTDFTVDSVSIMATSKDSMEEAGNGAKNIMESRHNNRGKDIYSADNVLKQLDQVNKVLGIFTAFIGAVAAISLIVGGIGVMNIMLVSVTERTREIGIRKAIGATTSAILIQFLTESVIISLLGGLIGMAIGIIGAELIGHFASITPSLSPVVIIGAILFSSAIGIFFGIYPAKKAAKLDPIEALRYE